MRGKEMRSQERIAMLNRGVPLTEDRAHDDPRPTRQRKEGARPTAQPRGCSPHGTCAAVRAVSASASSALLLYVDSRYREREALVVAAARHHQPGHRRAASLSTTTCRSANLRASAWKSIRNPCSAANPDCNELVRRYKALRSDIRRHRRNRRLHRLTRRHGRELRLAHQRPNHQRFRQLQNDE